MNIKFGILVTNEYDQINYQLQACSLARAMAKNSRTNIDSEGEKGVTEFVLVNCFGASGKKTRRGLTPNKIDSPTCIYIYIYI